MGRSQIQVYYFVMNSEEIGRKTESTSLDSK